MALNIKDPETDRLARDLADRMGTSITTALRVAIEERLRRTPRTPTGAAADLQAIIDRGRRRQLLDERAAEEILGYDEHGLPS